ncbi:MAG: hypothetical protein AB7N61_15960, partial [Acidimicrobiia bacterium]
RERSTLTMFDRPTRPRVDAHGFATAGTAGDVTALRAGAVGRPTGGRVSSLGGQLRRCGTH